jgi:nucleoside-diphosphate-sugar epimerase
MNSITGKRIALTGATGFLGSHIALALQARGALVRGVVRTPSKGAWLEEQGIELVKGDLTNPTSLKEAFQGCQAVISNAALAVRKRASWDDFFEANVLGSNNVFEALSEAGVPRAIQISSVGVYKMGANGPITESTPLRNGFEWDLSLFTTNWRYAATKSQGEQQAWEIAADRGVAMTSLRPGPIYGSRDHKMTQTFSKQLDRRLLIVPNIRLPMIHAGDVALATIAALERPQSVGNAYNLTGPSVSLKEVFTLLRELKQSNCRVCSVPLSLGRDFDNSAAIRDLDIVFRSLREGWSEALELL